MGRIRTIKPEMAKHEELYDAEIETGLPLRFAFAMLFTVCDREGRFRWRPRALKADVLPFDEVDFSRVLHALVTRGFLVRYACHGEEFGCIPTFTKHQVINNKESSSILPSHLDKDCEVVEFVELIDACLTRASRVPHACLTPLYLEKGEGKGKERKGNIFSSDSLKSDEKFLREENLKAQAIEVLSFLNQKRKELLPACRGFGYTKGNLKHILARLREKDLSTGEFTVTVALCRKVIVVQWRECLTKPPTDKYDPKEYFTPDTLFNSEKFWKYAGKLTEIENVEDETLPGLPRNHRD